MRNIQSIDIRFESDINTMWTLHHHDGTTTNFTSIDGGGITDDSDDSDPGWLITNYLWSVCNSITSSISIIDQVVEVKNLSPEGAITLNTTIDEKAC